MAIDDDVAGRLHTHAGLGALIGTRLYLQPPVEGEPTPLVVAQRISVFVEQPMSGLSIAGYRSLFQFQVRATTYASALAVQTQLVAAILAMTGSSVTIEGRWIEGLRGPEKELEAEWFRADVDATFLHTG